MLALVQFSLEIGRRLLFELSSLLLLSLPSLDLANPLIISSSLVSTFRPWASRPEVHSSSPFTLILLGWIVEFADFPIN